MNLLYQVYVCSRLIIVKDPYLTFIGPVGHSETFCGQWPRRAVSELISQSPRRAFSGLETIVGPLGRPVQFIFSWKHRLPLGLFALSETFRDQWPRRVVSELLALTCPIGPIRIVKQHNVRKAIRQPPLSPSGRSETFCGQWPRRAVSE